MDVSRRRAGLAILTAALNGIIPARPDDAPLLWGADRQPAPGDRDLNPAGVLTLAQWQEVNAAVDRGLEFLVRRQQPDGSFAGPKMCQPAMTGLCMMAFLSRGHLPGLGRYGRELDRAVDFVLATQAPSGLLSATSAEPYIAGQPNPWDDSRAHALYNHGIAGLVLAELYGMVDEQRSRQIHTAIVKALAFSRTHQISHKQLKRDYGGWRYLFHNNGMDSDLSVTAWQLMFYRSARNAEFEVPQQFVDDALAYVRSCFDPARGRFRYSHVPNDYRYTRAMSGAGILSLSLAGEHQTEMARAAADSLLTDSFAYNRPSPYLYDRYYYSVYYSTLGMFQIGGDHWRKFYPRVVEELVQNQRSDGSWDPDASDPRFGNTHTTAMLIMALTVADQLLPIYQR